MCVVHLLYNKPELKSNIYIKLIPSELSPIMFPSLPSSSPCALADGCAQLAQDLGLPTFLAALGIQVIKSRHFVTF